MSNKKKGTITSVTAIFVAATLAMFGISGDKTIEVDYTLETEGRLSVMTVNLPEEVKADMTELYCNNISVTKAVLPGGTLKSIPFVFSNLENLEVRFYKLNEVIGIGNFKDEKLYVAFNDDVIENAEVIEDAE